MSFGKGSPSTKLLSPTELVNKALNRLDTLRKDYVAVWQQFKSSEDYLWDVAVCATYEYQPTTMQSEALKTVQAETIQKEARADNVVTSNERAGKRKYQLCAESVEDRSARQSKKIIMTGFMIFNNASNPVYSSYWGCHRQSATFS